MVHLPMKLFVLSEGKDNLDQQAKEVAKAWREFQEWSNYSAGLADFARLIDETVPLEFDDYWENTTYQAVNYLLARAGALPAFREKPVKKVQKKTARKKSANSSTRKRKRKRKV